jgi:hypothetical protein
VVEEMFPLKCNTQELDDFISRSKKSISGWFGFYWGQTANDYGKKPADLASAIKKGWLEYFKTKAAEMNSK